MSMPFGTVPVRPVGLCSLCRGRVVIPIVWWGVLPPTPTCEQCGAQADTAAWLPLLPMKPPTPSYSALRFPSVGGCGYCGFEGTHFCERQARVEWQVPPSNPLWNPGPGPVFK